MTGNLVEKLCGFNCFSRKDIVYLISYLYHTTPHPSHQITSHHTTSHQTILNQITSHHTAPQHITSHHITPHHITSHHTTPHHTPHKTTLHHIKPQHTLGITSYRTTPEHSTYLNRYIAFRQYIQQVSRGHKVKSRKGKTFGFQILGQCFLTQRKSTK